MFSLHLLAVSGRVQDPTAVCSFWTQTAAAEFPLIFQDDDNTNYSNLCIHWPRTPETDPELSWSVSWNQFLFLDMSLLSLSPFSLTLWKGTLHKNFPLLFLICILSTFWPQSCILLPLKHLPQASTSKPCFNPSKVCFVLSLSSKLCPVILKYF